jgi:HKD family nuclease
MTLRFIENRKHRLLNEIELLLADASEACFAVAFVRTSGVNLINAAVQHAVARRTRVRVLFGRDWALTEAPAIRSLLAVGAQVKYYAGQETFHPKGYLFQHGSVTTAIIGSSNLSASGLTSGCEWNVSFSSDQASCIAKEFDRLWHSDIVRHVTEDVLEQLQRFSPPSELRDLLRKEDRPAPADAAPVVSFRFEVNDSFKNYPGHPKTVPKSQVPYDALRLHGFDSGELTISYANSTPLNGNMHSGTAGYGPYYQIRMSGPTDHLLFALPTGYRLLVRLEGSPGALRVQLAPA